MARRSLSWSSTTSTPPCVCHNTSFCSRSQDSLQQAPTELSYHRQHEISDNVTQFPSLPTQCANAAILRLNLLEPDRMACAMFKRLRQLENLAGGQVPVLFGAAVVLIIAAALFVPWQRMEQLTEQLNDPRRRGSGGQMPSRHHVAPQAVSDRRAIAPVQANRPARARRIERRGEPIAAAAFVAPRLRSRIGRPIASRRTRIAQFQQRSGQRVLSGLLPAQ